MFVRTSTQVNASNNRSTKHRVRNLFSDSSPSSIVKSILPNTNNYNTYQNLYIIYMIYYTIIFVICFL